MHVYGIYHAGALIICARTHQCSNAPTKKREKRNLQHWGEPIDTFVMRDAELPACGIGKEQRDSTRAEGQDRSHPGIPDDTASEAV